ncbi:hypothetical protein H6G65_19090 [Microcystis elabens FACHB-917]|nr:hypothetical protein [Microcystis elabens FACHB-917]
MKKTFFWQTRRRHLSGDGLPHLRQRALVLVSIPYVFYEAISMSVFAQQQIFSGLSGLTINPSFPGISGSDERFQLDSNLICPTATAGLGVFGGRGNSFAYVEDPFVGSSSNLTNYGIAAGIRVPLNNYLTEFCKDYAKRRIEFEGIRTENFKRNTLLSLIEQCRWAKRQGVNQIQNAEPIPGDDLGLGKFLAFCNNIVFNTSSENQLREIRLPKDQGGGKGNNDSGKGFSAPESTRQDSLNSPDSPTKSFSPLTPLFNDRSTPTKVEVKKDSDGPPQSDTNSFSQPNPVLQLQGQ